MSYYAIGGQLGAFALGSVAPVDLSLRRVIPVVGLNYGHGNTPFSASASAVGYLFQCRYALLESLRRLRRDDQFMVSIETLDDVVFERDGEPPDLLQTKHHIKKTANLTDTSPDLWKTIRIWCEGLINGNIPDAYVST